MNQIIGHNFWAMGSQINVWLDCENLAIAQQTMTEIEALFLAEEQRLSRFLSDSELSQLNARPEAWVTVSEPLWDVIVRALQLAEETGGLFDPTLLPELEAAGYRDSFGTLRAKIGAPLVGAMVEQPAIFQLDSLRGYEQVGLDGETRSVWLPSGMRLDLGGIGKGATAKTAVETICGTMPCLIDAGGDLTAGAAPHGWTGWPVGIKAPWADENLMRLWLVEGSLATSGIDYRRWEQGAREMHHIIDGRTGQPAETDLLSASVLTDDACRAEAWATAMVVAGAGNAKRLLSAQSLSGCLIHASRKVELTPVLAPNVQKERLSII